MLKNNQNFIDSLIEYNKKNYKKAFLKLITISNQYSKDLTFLTHLAQVQLQLNDFTAHLKTLKVISKISSQVEDKLTYMNYLLKADCRNEALDEGLKILTLNPNSEIKSSVCHNLMAIYILENDFEGLQEMTQQMLNEGIHSADLTFALSLLATWAGDSNKAIDYLRQTVVQNPLMDKAWVTLGMYHWSFGDLALAQANMEKAIDINPHNATALKHLTLWKTESREDLEQQIHRVNFFLQNHNFDEEMTQIHVDLLSKKGHSTFAQLEQQKIAYYFGHALSL